MPISNRAASSGVEAYTRACNSVINMENDPVHIPFAHRECELFANKPVAIPIKVDAEETDWGIDIRSTFANGWVHSNQRGWPNMTCFKSPLQHLTWRVPIDDDNHWSFQVDIMYDTAGPEKMKQYRLRHASRGGKVGRSYIELGEAILRGALGIQDIDGDVKANMIWIQDYVTQVRQGPLSERKNERLIRADVGHLLYRKLWEREVIAHAPSVEAVVSLRSGHRQRRRVATLTPSCSRTRASRFILSSTTKTPGFPRARE